MRGKVHLVATWWCMDCAERGEPVQTQEVANQEANAHVEATGHPTVTNLRPQGR